MRSIHCAHLIEAADKPSRQVAGIQIDDGRLQAVGDGAAPAGSADEFFVMPALVNAHDHGRAVRTSSLGASGKPLETWLQYQALIPVARSLSGRRRGAVARRARRGGRGDDAPHPAAGIDRSADRSGRDCARGARCRRAGRLCGIDARPQSAGLRPVRADPGRFAAGGAPGRSKASSRAGAATKEYIALVDEVASAAGRADCSTCNSGPNGVQWCSDALLAAIAECVPAHRPPHPHASVGDTLSAGLGGCRLSGRRGHSISMTLVCCRRG